MGFWSLFVVALMPVLKVLLVVVVGLFLAWERIDILGPTARIHVNNLVYYVLTPGLVGAYLADTITWSSILQMWFMPINILIIFIIGSAFGWILVKITRAPPHQHGLIIGCCAAGNLGNLFFILIPAICDESDSPFGDSSTCTTDGDAYSVLSMAIGVIYNWSYVYLVIKMSSDRNTSQEAIANISIASATPSESSEAWPGEVTEPLLSSEDQSCQIVVSQVDHEVVKVTFLHNIKDNFQNAGKYVLNIIFMPSIIAAIIGFIIGCVTPLRNLMIGDSAPLRTIYGAASLIGEAAIPTTTLLIGANLLKGLRSSGVGPIVIIGIILTKYAILPAIGIVVVKGAAHFGWVGTDSLYQFVLMLQYSLPPAMTVGTITQLFQTGQGDCSVIMLWTYAVAAIFLTVWETVYMSLVS